MISHAQRPSPSDEVNNNESKTSPLLDVAWNYALDFLDLQYWRTIACAKSEYDYEVIAEPQTLPECPDCARPDTLLKPTGTLVQSVTDEPREQRRVKIQFLRQRFQCACGRHLLQPLPGVVKGHAITIRGAVYAARGCFHRSFNDVGNELGVSSGMVKELFADFICALEAARTIEAPEILGMDGVCVGRRKHKRSYCLLTDVSNSQILELLAKSTQLEVARFLKQLPGKEKIKAVVIDMTKGLLSVAEEILPGAEVCIDPFHVVSKLNDAVTAVVRTRQQGMTPAERKRLMRGGNRFLLLKRRFELTGKQKEQLTAWFEEVPEFKQAYDLKEAGYDIYKATTRRSAEKRFEKWKEGIPENLKPTFKGFVRMVERWRPYIFNYFDYKVSNALTESRNRDVKTLQRDGRRTSHPVLRARLLYADEGRKPPRPKSDVKAKQIRQAMKEAETARRPPETWDPNSYVARINNARKAANEFSRMMRPPQGWENRFGHFSYYSKENSTHKWDFPWPVEGRSKKSKG